MAVSRGRLHRLGRDIYGRLSPEDRVRMMVENDAAEQPEQVKELVETCPVRAAKVRDWATYSRALAGIALAREASRALQAYRVAMAFRSDAGQLFLMAEMWATAAAREGGMDAEAKDGLIEAFEATRCRVERLVKQILCVERREYLEMLGAEWQAVDACARRYLHVSGETLLRAWGDRSALRWFEEVRSELDGIPIDDELAGKWQTYYERLFYCLPDYEEATGDGG